jgi:hypothetical protein
LLQIVIHLHLRFVVPGSQRRQDGAEIHQKPMFLLNLLAMLYLAKGTGRVGQSKLQKLV